MSCKCQDTGGRSCRREHPSDSWNEHLKYTVKQERKSIRRHLRMLERRYITDVVGFGPATSHQGPVTAPWLADQASA